MAPGGLLADDAAVSPVVGVILVVAITAILAGVVGTLVLDIGAEETQTAPSARLSFDYDEGATELTVTFESGDGVERADLEVRGDAGGVTTASDWPETDVGAGDQYVAGDVQADETVRVVWVGADDSTVIGRWEGPDA